MRNLFLIISAIFFTSTVSMAQRSNCSASPYPNTITQADGSKITLQGLGNEAVHYLETSDGYTVLKNADGNFEYAIIGTDGNLTSSGIKASDEMPVVYSKTDLKKHLHYSSTQVSVLMEYFQKLQKQQTTYNKTGANVFPPTGTHKVMVLLIEYPDLRATIAKSDFTSMFNQPNYGGTGSFNDYYKKASYGKLNLSVDVYGWYMAQNRYKYYGNTSSSNYGYTLQQLLQRAVFCADSAGVDFSQYDSDNDGYVDAVMVLHAGIGAEEASAPNSGDYIWSFRWTWNSSPTYNHSKKIYAYDMFPERRNYTNAMVGIGVMTHEFGHILDLPDLYAVNYTSEGVGDYANMAGGPWLNNEHTPCLHDAWSRIQLGWLNATTINKTGTYTIAKCVADSNFTFKINTSRSNEYFLLENRQWKGFDRYLPSKGLAIWHVNSNVVGKLSYLGNSANNDTSNMGMSILQADGRRDLENMVNRGDGGDLFPGSTNNHNVTPYTKPNSSLTYKVGGVRQSSNLYITGITVNPDSSITFKFGTIASASYTSSVTSGCAPLSVSFTNNSVFASSYKWNLGDGTISTDTNQKHIYTIPGTYTVWLRVLDSSGSVVDSINQTIIVNSSPVANVGFARFGDEIHFTNSSTGASNYLWQFGNYSSSKKVLDSIDLRMIQDSGIVNFTLIAFSSNGCTDTAKFQIDVWKTGINNVSPNTLKINVSPNPIDQTSMLTFTTLNTENVSIEIFNMLGQKVATIENNELQSGLHQYEISKNILSSSGVYLIKINSSTQTGFVRLLNR